MDMEEKEVQEPQKFQILVDGVEKTAEVLDVVEVDDKEYAIYAIDKDGETSDVFASRVIQDSEGNDQLVDLETKEEKDRILEIIKEMFA